MTIIAIIAGVAMVASVIAATRQGRALFWAFAGLFGLIGVAALGFLPGGWLAPVILAVLIVLGILIASAKFMAATAALSVLAFIVLTFAGSITGIGDSPAQAVETTAPTQPAAATPSPEGTPTCDAKYVQVEVSNEGGKVNANFAQAYAEATASAASLNEAQRTVILDESAKSALVLAANAHAFGLYEEPNNWQPLVDGSCLSTEGMLLHAELKGALNAKGVKFEEADAPANGYNSGITDGVYGVAAEPGIRGDRKAIKVTLPDGSVVYIMVRCGNPVYDIPPDLPEVPTDDPPPPPPPPPPADVCPWNPALPKGHPDCLKPKSEDPDDYRRPGDDGKGPDVGDGKKPKAPNPGTPPEKEPTPVETRKPGGGDVEDTPTKPPGSETGVKAPGADPAPTPTTPPPPQESGGNGDNDGVVDGF